MNTNNNPFEPYYAGAFRAALTSCFIGGRISEQQIDLVKETISRFKEAEIDQSVISDSAKEGENLPGSHLQSIFPYWPGNQNDRIEMALPPQ